MRLFKINKNWQVEISFENPFNGFGTIELLSFNWEKGVAYYLTICNIVFQLCWTKEYSEKTIKMWTDKYDL